MFQQKKFGLPESLIKAVSEAVKAHTVPKTEKEKKLAALAHPKDKITHKDVMVGRGVIAKEEKEEVKEAAGASKKEEEKFHMGLDKLVHKTFGHSPAEKKEKKMAKEEVKLDESPVDGVAAGSMEGDKHMCASKVMHKEWKEGTPLFSQHAEPAEDGSIAWYDVMFEHGIERVMTSDIEILVSESHMNHKKKKMKEEVELEEGNVHSIKKQEDGSHHVFYKDDFDKVKHIGTIHPPIRGSEGRYTAKHKDGKRMTPSSDIQNLAKQLSRYHNKEFREDVESIDEKITVVPAGSPETGVQRIKTPSGGTITTGTVARRPKPSASTSSSSGVTQRPDVTKNLSVKSDWKPSEKLDTPSWKGTKTSYNKISNKQSSLAQKEEIEHIEERENAEERIKGGRDKYRLGDKLKQSADHSLELKNLRHSLHMKKMQKYHEVETNSLENRKKRDDASTDHHIAYFKKRLERMDRDDDSHDANLQAIRDNMAARRKYMYGEEYESVPASKALQKAHDDERKKRGLPDPSYYLELIKKKKKEIEDMKKEDVEQVNELKLSTVQSYMQKRENRPSRVATAIKDMETGSSKSKVHSAGLKRAKARMDKEEDKKRVPRRQPTPQEIEQGRLEIPSWWTRGT